MVNGQLLAETLHAIESGHGLLLQPILSHQTFQLSTRQKLLVVTCTVGPGGPGTAGAEWVLCCTKWQGTD